MRALLLLALAAAAGCASADPPRAPFTTAAEVDAWMEGYALHPEPDRLLEAVARGRTGGEPHHDFPPLLLGFTAELFRLHPERLDGWVDALPAATEEDRNFLQMALWLCGTDGSARRMKELRASMPPRERDGHATWAFDLLRMPVRNLPLAAPPMVDVLWGAWLASGDPALVRRIVDAVPWASSKNRELRESGEAARDSLLLRAARDPRVLAILREEAAAREGLDGMALRGVLERLDAGSAGDAPPAPTAPPPR